MFFCPFILHFHKVTFKAYMQDESDDDVIYDDKKVEKKNMIECREKSDEVKSVLAP